MLIQLIKHFAKSQSCFPTVNCMQREKYVQMQFSNGHQNPSMINITIRMVSVKINISQ